MRDLTRHDLDYLDHGTIRVEVTRELAATPAEIWEELADAPSWPEWFLGARRLRWVTRAPHGVGSRREISLATISILEEFLVWEPGERFAFALIGAEGSGSQILRGGVEQVTLDAGTVGHTVTTYRMSLDVVGPRAAMRPLVGPGAKLTVQTALGRLEKRIIAART